MAQVINEKVSLKPVRAAGVPQTLSRRKASYAIAVLALLLTWHIALPLFDFEDILDAFRWHEAISRSQCPQVDPLRPQHRSEELLKMEHYLASDDFRNASIARLSGAVQIPTESYDDLGEVGEDKRWEIFFDFAAYLEKTYPLVHQTLQLAKVNTHGLAYTWLGSDITRKPLLLMAHQDVVPVAQDTVGSWTHPPYSGFYDGKLIWGRGSSDCKNSLTGILESLENLIAAEFKPTRSIVLAFGFDEESSGARGAGELSEFLLQKHGQNSFSAIVDEGAGYYTKWGRTFALPGVAEKGYIDVNIVVRMPGGHSSIPPDHNGIGVMSQLVTLIEANLYEPKLVDDNPYLGMLQCGVAHGSKFPSKLKKLLSRRSSKSICSKKADRLAIEASKDGLDIKYLMTTSVAVDIIRGGVKNNALPERTQVTVNHRINVGETTAVVKDKITHLAKHVAAKYNLTVHAFSDEEESPSSITISSGHELEPSPITPTMIDPFTPYSVLSGTTRALFGEDIIVSPGIMSGNTDISALNISFINVFD